MQYGYPKAKTHKPKQVSTITLWGGVGLGLYRSFGCSMVTLKQKPINPKQVSTITLWGVGLGLYRSFGCSMVTLKQKPINPKQVSTITLWGGGRFGIIQELWVQYGYPKAKTHKPKTSFNNNPMGWGVGLGLYRSFGCSMVTLKQKPINPKQVSTITLWGGGRCGIIQELWVQYGYPKAKTHRPKTSFNNNPMGGGSVWDYTGALGAVWLP